MTFQNNNQFDNLIKEAGQKMGGNPQQLKQAIDAGKLDDVVNKMHPNDAQRFKEVMSNPILAKQMLQTPQAQMLIKKFMNDSAN